ncbi:uncharacterized protein LOC128385892 isoform X2 [Panonychus citri]|uniref:uncharacterized protein LOC128385892 isoform X2 n=1 Tax=Panonychus citri TaxID=50023 RepID=UPI002307C585|nr:uncharacterized protein LOC128385892 isoform X2 [Panonychus citri]
MSIMVLIILYFYMINFINCGEVSVTIPEGEFEIEGLINYGYRYSSSQSEQYSFSEIMIISDSLGDANGLTEFKNLYRSEEITVYHNLNNTNIKHLIIKGENCVDMNDANQQETENKLMNKMLNGIYFFYFMVTKYFKNVTVYEYCNSYTRRKTLLLAIPDIMKKNFEHMRITLTFTCDTGSESINFSQLKEINIKKDYFQLRFFDINVTKLSTGRKIIQPPLEVNCPYLFHHGIKFPGSKVFQEYHVNVSETFVDQSVGLKSTSEFIIETLEEISSIKRFQGGVLMESINDYRLGLKYVLGTNKDNGRKCKVEPIPIDSDTITLTYSQLSFNKVAWLDLEYDYKGQYLLSWEPKNITFNVWRAVESDKTENDIIYNNISTTLYMLEKLSYEEKFHVTINDEDTFSGYILVYATRDLYPMYENKKISQVRSFFNFTMNIDGIRSSASRRHQQLLSNCYDDSDNIANITLNLKIAKTESEPNLIEVEKSLIRIISNFLHISFLRIISINLTSPSKIYINATIRIAEAIDLLNLHSKSYRKFNRNTLAQFDSIDAENDDDCLIQQAERHDTSYVISCDSEQINSCIRLSTGQPLPHEDSIGTVCLVYNNFHDTLASFTKETPLASLLKPAFTLRGIKFLVSDSHFQILDAWTSKYENAIVPMAPDKKKKEFVEKTKPEQNNIIGETSKRINSTHIKLQNYNGTTNYVQNPSHLVRHLVLTIVLILTFVLIGFGLKRWSYSRSIYSISEVVSLTTLDQEMSK